MREALRDTTYLRNLLIMCLNWGVCSLSNYIISYYVGGFPGNIFLNSMIMVASDIISSLLCVVYIKYLGFNKGFFVGFSIAVAVTIAFAFVQTNVYAGYICVFVMKLGVAICFNMCYFGTSEYFDANVKSRSYAISNFFARTLTITAPMIVALMPHPIIVITILTFVTAITSMFLKKPAQKDA